MNRTRWLLLTILCAFALCFTRYAGLAIVLGAGVMLKTWRDRLAVILPPLVIAAVVFIVTGTMKPHMILGKGSLANAMHIPIELVLIASSPVVLAGLVYLIVKDHKLGATRLIVGAVLVYVLGLFVLVALLNGINPTLDARLFVPVTGLIFLLGIGLTLRQAPKAAPYLLAGLLLYCLLSWFDNNRLMRRPEYKILNSPRFSQSEVVGIVKQAPAGTNIYCNTPSAIWLHTGRVARGLKETPYKTPFLLVKWGVERDSWQYEREMLDGSGNN